MLKSKKLLQNKNLFNNNVIEKFNFLTLNTRTNFNYLQIAFTKALIL